MEEGEILDEPSPPDVGMPRAPAPFLGLRGTLTQSKLMYLNTEMGVGLSPILPENV